MHRHAQFSKAEICVFKCSIKIQLVVKEQAAQGQWITFMRDRIYTSYKLLNMVRFFWPAL